MLRPVFATPLLVLILVYTVHELRGRCYIFISNVLLSWVYFLYPCHLKKTLCFFPPVAAQAWISAGTATVEIYYKIPAFTYHSYTQEENSTEVNSALIRNRRQMDILKGVTCFMIKTKMGCFYFFFSIPSIIFYVWCFHVLVFLSLYVCSTLSIVWARYA